MHVTNGRLSGVRFLFLDKGRTIMEDGALLPGAKEVLHELKYTKGYLLKMASILPPELSVEQAMIQLRELDIYHYFEQIMFTDESSKFKVLTRLRGEGAHAIPANQIAVVGDRTVDGRCLHWGWFNQTVTIWLKRGKYATQGPPTHRKPDYTISSITELRSIFQGCSK